MSYLVAGDTIIDWIISDKKVTPTVGGAGNIVRGLEKKGHPIEFLTLYNPSLYPLSYQLDLHPNSLTDLQHRNVFVRDYDRDVFQRFREHLQSNVIDVKGAFAVVCHEDSIIRRFNSLYADVRDTSVRGECHILRMSSTDDTEAIKSKISYDHAIITYKDKVEVETKGEITRIDFPQVQAKDDIGAGDSFNVGFLDWFILTNFMDSQIKTAIFKGIEVAQEKVTNIGVFMK